MSFSEVLPPIDYNVVIDNLNLLNSTSPRPMALWKGKTVYEIKSDSFLRRLLNAIFKKMGWMNELKTTADLSKVKNEMETTLKNRNIRFIDVVKEGAPTQQKAKADNVAELERSITEKSQLVEALEAQLANNTQAAQQTAAKITELERSLSQKSQRTEELEKQLANNNQAAQQTAAKITELERSLTQKSQRTEELEAQLDNNMQNAQKTATQVAVLTKNLLEKAQFAENLEKQLEKKTQEAQETADNAAELTRRLSEKTRLTDELETKLKRKIQEAQQSADNIADLARKLSQKNQELEDKNQEIEKLAGKVNFLYTTPVKPAAVPVPSSPLETIRKEFESPDKKIKSSALKYTVAALNPFLVSQVKLKTQKNLSRVYEIQREIQGSPNRQKTAEELLEAAKKADTSNKYALSSCKIDPEKLAKMESVD